MATSDKVDREAVEKFFTWEGPMQLLLAGGQEAAVEKFFTWESRTQLLLVGGLVSLLVGFASLLVGLYDTPYISDHYLR